MILIYLFQKIKGHTKLFFLFSILLILYAVGELLHLSSLLIVLIFGIILNNYKFFFISKLKNFIQDDKVNSIQEDFKVIIMESAFVVRTFFFILFGYYVSLDSLLNIEVIIVSLVLLATIYSIRFILIFPIMGGRSWPELFLSPRGLITILLFFSIPEEYILDDEEFDMGDEDSDWMSNFDSSSSLNQMMLMMDPTWEVMQSPFKHMLQKKL